MSEKPVFRRLILELVKEEMLAEAGGGYHPPGHRLGMRVPKGGSMCANCKWLDSEKYCANKYFQRWNSDVNGAKMASKLPAPADEYCCDNWEG